MISNRTTIEISAENLRHNFLELAKGLPEGTRTMAVVKSNAYGHGMLQCAWALAEYADWFGVDDIEEAKILRQHGIRNPILVLGAIPQEWYPVAHSLDLTVTSTSLVTLRWAVHHNVMTHIKIDSGLGRQGFVPLSPDMQALREYLGRNKPREVTGVYSHLAVGDDPEQVEFTLSQLEIYNDACGQIETILGRKLDRHISASAGTLYLPQLFSDGASTLARFGIGLYGLWPSRELQNTATERELRPVMTWVSYVSEIKKLPRGHSVGYSRTHVLARNSTVGIVPVGYWHGLPRSLSNRGWVMIHGCRAPIIGNVSMDMIIVDLTDIPTPLSERERVVVLGPGVTAEDIADLAGTINYEIVTRVNPLIDRKVVREK